MNSPLRQAIPGFNGEQHRAMLALMADLRYPVGANRDNVALLDGLPWRDGDQGQNILDSMKAVIAYHLVRCGWRPDMGRRLIKARKVLGGGVFDDAVTWIGVGEPDDPLANLAQMTISEIQELPEDVRVEAMRRIGLKVEAPKRPEGWVASPVVNIADAPDNDDEEDD